MSACSWACVGDGGLNSVCSVEDGAPIELLEFDFVGLRCVFMVFMLFFSFRCSFRKRTVDMLTRDN